MIMEHVVVKVGLARWLDWVEELDLSSVLL